MLKKGQYSGGVIDAVYGQFWRKPRSNVFVEISISDRSLIQPPLLPLHVFGGWTSGARRCGNAGIPCSIVFQKAPHVAAQQIRDRQAAGFRAALAFQYAAYRSKTMTSAELPVISVRHGADTHGILSLWRPGLAPLPAKARIRRCGPAKNLQCNTDLRAVAAKASMFSFGPAARENLARRQATSTRASTHQARVRVRPAPRANRYAALVQEEALIIGWQKDGPTPSTYCLPPLPNPIPLDRSPGHAKIDRCIVRNSPGGWLEIGPAYRPGEAKATLTIPQRPISPIKTTRSAKGKRRLQTSVKPRTCVSRHFPQLPTRADTNTEVRHAARSMDAARSRYECFVCRETDQYSRYAVH